MAGKKKGKATQTTFILLQFVMTGHIPDEYTAIPGGSIC